MKRALAVVALLLLTGCVNNPPPIAQTAQNIDASIETYSDTATGITVRRGPYLTQGNARFWLASFTKGGVTDYALTFSDTGGEWAFYNSAFADGKEFDVTVADRQVGYCSQYGCDLSERLRVHFTKADLLPYTKTPMRLAIIGVRARIDLTIPDFYISRIVSP